METLLMKQRDVPPVLLVVSVLLSLVVLLVVVMLLLDMRDTRRIRRAAAERDRNSRKQRQRKERNRDRQVSLDRMYAKAAAIHMFQYKELDTVIHEVLLNHGFSELAEVWRASGQYRGHDPEEEDDDC